LTKVGPIHSIEGYANHVSILPGQPVRLYVSTTSAGFTVTAFRIGWYHGVGARRIWRSRHIAGRRQAAARVIPATRTVTAPWRPSLTVHTTGWPPGDYLFRLTADSGFQRYMPLTVRTADNRGRLVLVNAVTTWQAYNFWGDRNLYYGPDLSFASRSYAVSFDRPYRGDGAGLFFQYERPAVALAERLGLNLGYTTGVDLDRDPHILDGARAMISLGHDEYWSATMRRTVTAHRNAGMNIAFLGANAVFRHIRYGSTRLGSRRLVICYKLASLDPLYGKDNAQVTADWREPPDPRPESTLTGTFYESSPVHAAMVITDPPRWLFAGTGVRAGTRLAGIVGIEYDRVNPGVPTPRPIQVIAHSPVTARGVHSYADMAYYTTRSRAGVLDTGTNNWVAGIVGNVVHGAVGRFEQRIISRATANLFRAFAAGPAGRVHPAHGNLARLHAWPGDPIAADHNLW
jgi:hypothetical protein